MQRRSVTLTLGANPIVSIDTGRRLIDFQETRFRIHSLRFQESVKPLATELASEVGVPLSCLDDLSSKDENQLTLGAYCVFDFLDVKTRRERGFLRVRWIPFAIFVRGERVFSLHASYGNGGARLTGLTLRRETQDEYTRCTTRKSAAKVGRSFVRTYIQGNS